MKEKKSKAISRDKELKYECMKDDKGNREEDSDEAR